MLSVTINRPVLNITHQCSHTICHLLHLFPLSMIFLRLIHVAAYFGVSMEYVLLLLFITDYVYTLYGYFAYMLLLMDICIVSTVWLFQKMLL